MKCSGRARRARSRDGVLERHVTADSHDVGCVSGRPFRRERERGLTCLAFAGVDCARASRASYWREVLRRGRRSPSAESAGQRVKRVLVEQRDSNPAHGSGELEQDRAAASLADHLEGGVALFLGRL